MSQSNSIHVASNTSLRASNSLSAGIVETVPTATVWTVLSEFIR